MAENFDEKTENFPVESSDGSTLGIVDNSVLGIADSSKLGK